MKKCRGNHLRRIPGPRVAALYGSWETEICLNCWRHRVNRHGWSKWTRNRFPQTTVEEYTDDLPF